MRPRKLTDAQEAELVARYELGRRNTVKALMSDFGISREMLRRVVLHVKHAKLPKNPKSG